MAHGTGLYVNRMYKQEIQNDQYYVWVYRTYNYYYPQYSDCYEPTSEALDEFKITVAKYEPNGAWYTADPDKGVTVRLEDKNEVNKILWNIKHRNISYEAIEAYFATLNK